MTIGHMKHAFTINVFESYCTIIINYFDFIWSHATSVKLPFDLFESRIIEKIPFTFLKILSFDELIVPFGSLLLYNGCTFYGSQS